MKEVIAEVSGIIVDSRFASVSPDTDDRLPRGE
jgi:hypothetical protein